MLQLHKFGKCFIKPFSVRYSGNFSMQSTETKSLIRQTLDRSSKPTTNDWHALRQKLLQSMPKESSVDVDFRIFENCFPNQLNIAKSYIDYLQRTGQELRVYSLAILLKLYYSASKHGTEITASDQQNIIDICQHLLEKCPVSIRFTKGSAIIKGLVLTGDWRKSLDVLDSINIYSKPAMSTYSAVVQRAIIEEDKYLVWNLLNDMVRDCGVLDNNVFTIYINHCKKNESSFTENIDKMLTFIGDNHIVVSTKVANEFQSAFHRFNHSCHITTVSDQGECHWCRKRLRDRCNVTDDDFNSQRSHFSDKAFVRSKSTTEELESFEAFIDRTMPYDCVIDGLNTSWLGEWAQADVCLKSSKLASVIKHFVDRKKTVLVIGRKHMLARWPKAQINYIRNNAHLFITENLSEDDPFFVYSALKSGPNTDLVTCDLLRDQCMNNKLKTVFRQWQQQHQCRLACISNSGSVWFENRIDFDMNAHQVDVGCWHIPYKDRSICTFQQYELRKHWLCVSTN